MNILIIDDIKEECSALSEFIKDMGHETVCSYDGKDAIDKINKIEFDLVISDVNLPFKNGLEIAEFIKIKKSRINVILISGIDDIIKSINAIELGILDFLTKPVDIRKLAFLIDEADKRIKSSNEQIHISYDKEIFLDINIYKFSNDFSIQNDFIGKIGIFSEKMFSIYRKLKKLEEFQNIPVLLEGETGTGKEIIAKYIHYENLNNKGEFIALNCSNLSTELFDAEIFGYDKGSFTGADSKGKEGKIKLAENGTLFLDEITELSLELQAKLLRVIQEREYYKIGGTKKEPVNARIVVSTNKDINKLVSEKKFREDLYYRLNICKVKIPPLHERREEIVPLVIFFVRTICAELGKKIEKIETHALKTLEGHEWPGNVRELRNLILKIILFSEEKIITKKIIQMFLDQEKQSMISNTIQLMDFIIPDNPFSLEDFNSQIIKQTLNKFNGNKANTAKFLGLTRSQLYGKYKI